jgi:hypothetical protein
MKQPYSLGVLTLSLLLSSCGGGGGGDTDANDPPQIAGKSSDYVRSGKDFVFTPTAFDPDNDELRYTIENKPGWAVFDEITGTMSGKPDDSYAQQQFDNIIISVSDGEYKVSLPPFSIKVMYAEVGRGNVQIDPLAAVTNTPGGYDVVGDAKIAVGSLETDFKNADLQFEYDANGDLLDLVGTTDLPPVISDTLSVNTGAQAVVGLYTGAEINARMDIGPDSDPGILLRDEFRYLVYFLGTNVELVFHGLAADVVVPLAGTQTLIITDPTDPMFYYFGEIAGFAAGYGKSFNGNIPYEPLFDPAGPVAFNKLEPFYGTDVLKGTFPITAYKVFDLLELSGTAICAPPQLLDCDKPTPLGIVISLADALLIQGAIDPEQQFKVGINGSASIEFRVFGIDLFSYHLFDMASQIDVGTVREHLAIQGVIDPGQSDSPGWIPIKPVPDPGVVMVGNLFADVDTMTGDGDFGISLYGEFPSTFPAATISGSIDINAQGLQFRGTVPDPDNPITVTASADVDQFTAGIEFGYDFNSNIDTVVDDGINRALDKVDQVTQDLQDAIGAYDLAFSLDGFRNNIPALVTTAINILNGVPTTVYNTVRSGVLNGINSKSYTYNPCSPITNCSITIYAKDYVNETSIANNAASDARSTAQGIVNARIAELNELKAQAEEVQDGPVFRAALKTALETVAGHDKISVSVPSKSITVDYVVTTKTYTVFSGTTLTYTVFDATTKSNLLTAAANVDNIDPAQTFVVNTQQIFDQLPTKNELNQVAQDVNDGIVRPPVVRGGGYTVTRTGAQSAYVLLGNDQVEISFNPLDPAAALEGVGNAIVDSMTP